MCFFFFVSISFIRLLYSRYGSKDAITPKPKILHEQVVEGLFWKTNKHTFFVVCSNQLQFCGRFMINFSLVCAFRSHLSFGALEETRIRWRCSAVSRKIEQKKENCILTNQNMRTWSSFSFNTRKWEIFVALSWTLFQSFRLYPTLLQFVGGVYNLLNLIKSLF